MFYDDTKELYFIKSKFQEHAFTKYWRLKWLSSGQNTEACTHHKQMKKNKIHFFSQEKY